MQKKKKKKKKKKKTKNDFKRIDNCTIQQTKTDKMTHLSERLHMQSEANDT